MPDSLHPHTLTLSNRREMSVSGVTQVVAYDEFHIILKTDYGQLIIRGKNLVAGAISSSQNSLKLTGDIEVLQYRAIKDKSQNFLSRIMK